MSNAEAAGVFGLGPVGKGALSMGPRPSSDALDDWCAAIKAQGISHVISLITDEEVARYGLKPEKEILHRLGINFIRFPVDDFTTPDAAAFPDLIASLQEIIATGGHIFAHCAGGVGRAGTTMACLLVAHGWKADEAMHYLSEKRGIVCPETPEQVAFVRGFANVVR